MLSKSLPFLSVFLLAVLTLSAASVRAQGTGETTKPLVYTFTLDWTIPPQAWADMDKQQIVNARVLQKAFDAGKILGFGSNDFFLHAENKTHRTFWSGSSVASVLELYEELKQSGATSTLILRSATNYTPRIFMSHHYNSKPGARAKSGYAYEAVFQLVPNAPQDALEIGSKTFLIPMFERMLSEGSIDQYQISYEGAFHTRSGKFFVISLSSSNAKVYDAFVNVAREFEASNSWSTPLWFGWNDLDKHFDYLSRTDYSFK